MQAMTVYDLTGTGGSASTGSARMEVALALVASGACVGAGSADLKLIKGLRVTQAGLQGDVATDLVRVTQAGLQGDVGTDLVRVTQAGLQVDARQTVPVDVTQAGLQTDVAGEAVRLTQAGVQVDGRSVRPEVALNCWEFHVTDRWGTYLAMLDGAFEKGYLAQLNEVGSGSFRLHVNDPKATSANLAIGNVVLVRYRNVDVGAFVIEEVQEALVGPDEEPGQIISVSGRGLLSGLEAGLVYPGDLADPATTTRQFTAQTRAGILLTLYNEFMARGGGDLSPDFSATHDSGLALWTDSTTLDVKAGGSLLATAKSLCALGLDLTVEMPGRVLRAWLAAGVDRRATVVFRHGQNLLTCGRQRSGRELVNAVLAEGQGLLVESVDGPAAGAYGRREGYLTAGNSADVTQVTAASALLLAQRKAPATALELTVTPYEFFPLLDYGLGDTITLDAPGTASGAYRVLSVAIREVGGPCELAVTLEVNSLALAYLVRMQKQLEASQANAASQASATTGLAHAETRPPVLAGHTHVEADITDLEHDAVKLQGRALAATAPTDGQAVVWDDAGSTWKPGTVSGGSGGGIPAPATPEQGDVLYYNGRRGWRGRRARRGRCWLVGGMGRIRRGRRLRRRGFRHRPRLSRGTCCITTGRRGWRWRMARRGRCWRVGGMGRIRRGRQRVGELMRRHCMMM